MLSDSLALAERLISEHRSELDSLTEELLLKETLDDSEIRALLGFPESKPRDGDVRVPAKEGDAEEE
jgi:cell division protease FtsH